MLRSAASWRAAAASSWADLVLGIAPLDSRHGVLFEAVKLEKVGAPIGVDDERGVLTRKDRLDQHLLLVGAGEHGRGGPPGGVAGGGLSDHLLAWLELDDGQAQGSGVDLEQGSRHEVVGRDRVEEALLLGLLGRAVVGHLDHCRYVIAGGVVSLRRPFVRRERGARGGRVLGRGSRRRRERSQLARQGEGPREGDHGRLAGRVAQWLRLDVVWRRAGDAGLQEDSHGGGTPRTKAGRRAGCRSRGGWRIHGSRRCRAARVYRAWPGTNVPVALNGKRTNAREAVNPFASLTAEALLADVRARGALRTGQSTTTLCRATWT
jgi:hypothetical protein